MASYYKKSFKFKEMTKLRKFSVMLIVTLVMMMVLSGIALAELSGNTRGTTVPNQDQYFYLPTSNDGLEAGNTTFYLPNYQNPASYRIHTNYTADTDACASCHSTHTAVGASLLQWYSVYETCMACHDGTVTNTYNVVDGKVGAHNKTTSGGLFGQMSQSAEVDSLSNHNASGGLNIYAAYGGRRTPKTNGTWADEYGTWNDTFTCASCHTPHGLGGNPRILHPDVNGVARQKAKDVTSGWTVNTQDGYIEFNDIILTGYPYNTEYTFVYVGGTAEANIVSKDTYKISNVTGKGRIYIANPASVQKVKYVPSLRVQFKVDNYLAAGEKVTHVSGVNAFCAACHTDYKAVGQTAGSELTGVYSKAYRHPVEFKYDNFYAPNNVVEDLGMKFEKHTNGDVMTCLTCHFAHGTNKDLWEATLTGSAYTGGFDELNRSSALKRIPNMGTCEGCHQKALASEGYWVNSGQNAPAEYPEGGGSYGVFSQTSAAYVGSDACKSCHGGYYEKWKDTDHTKKATKGPRLNNGQTGEIYPHVVANWDSLTTYMIIDGSSSVIWLTPNKIALQDVDYVIGFRVKQRYLTFWDGVVPDNVLKATSENGISFKLEMEDGSPKVYTRAESGLAQTIKSRAGYKFLFMETLPQGGENAEKYGEIRSWQQRCIACHTTGFDDKAWDNALTAYNPATLPDKVANPAGYAAAVAPIQEVYVADLRVGCEACHGPGSNHVTLPGKKNIANPARFTDDWDRLTTCSQCHTRTTSHKGTGYGQANDLRGFKVGVDMDYWKFTEQTRPAWSTNATDLTLGGNRQVSADGKGRRGHQQDMDLLMTKHAAGNTVMGKLTCFSCHDAHNIKGEHNYAPYNRAVGQRMKTSPAQTCATCHSSMNLSDALVGTGGTWNSAQFGFAAGSFVPRNGDIAAPWTGNRGRGYAKQHMFNYVTNANGTKSTAGFTSTSQLTWAETGSIGSGTIIAIWPWEYELFVNGKTNTLSRLNAARVGKGPRTNITWH